MAFNTADTSCAIYALNAHRASEPSSRAPEETSATQPSNDPQIVPFYQSLLTPVIAHFQVPQRACTALAKDLNVCSRLRLSQVHHSKSIP